MEILCAELQRLRALNINAAAISSNLASQGVQITSGRIRQLWHWKDGHPKVKEDAYNALMKFAKKIK